MPLPITRELSARLPSPLSRCPLPNLNSLGKIQWVCKRFPCQLLKPRVANRLNVSAHRCILWKDRVSGRVVPRLATNAAPECQ